MASAPKICAECANAVEAQRRGKVRLLCAKSGKPITDDESLAAEVRDVNGACGPSGALWEAVKNGS